MASDAETAAGYDQTDFEIVAHGNVNYELPVSTPATYRMTEPTDPSTGGDQLEREGYAFIAPHREVGRLSTKVLDTETNEFFHLKVVGESVLIYSKDESFSEDTFCRVVKCIDEEIVRLELESE